MGTVAGIGCGVDGRLLLAFKSLYSCSNVYVRVWRIKSRPFTVSVGLRQWCVLSSLLFIVYSNVAKLRPSGRIRPSNQFNPTHQIQCLAHFFKCHFSDCGQQRHSINCCLSRKSHCILLSSGQAVANSALLSKRLATPGLHELDRQSQPSRGVCHICELQDQPFTFYRRFGILLASSQQGLQHALDRFSTTCDRTRMKISTKNTEVLCLCTNQRQCMLQGSGIHSAGGEIQVHRSNIYE